MSTKYYQEDQANHIYFKEKYDKKTIVIYSGPSWEKWNFNSCESGGIGGSETHQIKIGEEFAKLGYRVLNFADCSLEGKFNGVDWHHFSRLHDFLEYNYFDYFIASRTTDVFRLSIRAGKKLVIIHDIWLSSQNQVAYQEKVDKFLVLSEWHKNFVHQHHSIPLDKLVITSNGVDLKRFEKKVERHPYRLHWSSSLDRGLDILLHLFDIIKLSIPELELHIYYGLDNWLKSAQYKPGEIQKIEAIQAAMKKKDVFYHGRIGQDKLAEEQLKASLWLYPTCFTETWCITAVEMMAAGVPIICSNLAGLQDTVGNYGILIGNGELNQALTKECKEQFVNKSIEVLKDKKLWDSMSFKGLQKASQFSWRNVAKNFINLLEA